MFAVFSLGFFVVLHPVDVRSSFLTYGMILRMCVFFLSFFFFLFLWGGFAFANHIMAFS